MKKERNLEEFNHIVKELLEHQDVQRLGEFRQHIGTNRLEHSMNVAYFSYRTCKRFGLDYRSATRAGLLHDLFLYDWRSEKQPEGAHAFAHPIVALRNARNIAPLNAIEEDAIVNHMWPVTPSMPCYAESMVVSCADKYSTCVEVAGQVYRRTKARFSGVRKAVFSGAYAKQLGI